MHRWRQIFKLSRLWKESCVKYILTYAPIAHLREPTPFIPKNKFKRVRSRLHRKGII